MPGHGPPQKHSSTRVRRNAPLANTIKLPAEGRKGPVPSWPLPPDQRLRAEVDMAETEAALLETEIAGVDDLDERAKLRRGLRRLLARAEVARSDLLISEKSELALWKVLWALPQAVAWERFGYLNEVAQYVRWKTRAELGEMAASKESRLLSKELGLTPASMVHLHWEISTDELAEKRGDPAEQPTTRRRSPAKKAAAAEDPRNALRLA